MTVALIFGGRGFEREVSVEGARFVYPLIPREKYDVIPVFITPDGRWLLAEDDLHGSGGMGLFTGGYNDLQLPSKESFCVPSAPMNLSDRQGLIYHGGFIPLDVAFPLLHGDFGEDGVVQGALENAKIKFVGEDAVTGAACLDKRLTHLIAGRLGIPTASAIFADACESLDSVRERAERIVGYPMFLKPSDLGSSVGATPVRCASELDAAFTRAKALSGRGLIIEELVDIESELEIGVLISKGKQIFTNIGQIRASSGFYDYNEKYDGASLARVCDSPCIEGSVIAQVREYATRLCGFLGIRSLCRIDFFRTKDGKIIFNEINTMPGFTGASLYPRLAAEAGFEPQRLVDALISEALL